MLDHALEQHEDSAEGGEAFGSALHLAPVFPQHDCSGSAYFADFDLPHLDCVHEHSHHQPHSSSDNVRHSSLSHAFAFQCAQRSALCVRGELLKGFTSTRGFASQRYSGFIHN